MRPLSSILAIDTDSDTSVNFISTFNKLIEWTGVVKDVVSRKRAWHYVNHSMCPKAMDKALLMFTRGIWF